jgi:hypothetical protein
LPTKNKKKIIFKYAVEYGNAWEQVWRKTVCPDLVSLCIPHVGAAAAVDSDKPGHVVVEELAAESEA